MSAGKATANRGKKSDWPPDKEQKLIQLFKERDVLYKPLRCRKTLEKDEAYSEIAAELGVDINEVKKHLKSLRDQHTRLTRLSEQPQSCASAQTERSKYILKHLSFLHPYLKRNASGSSADDTEAMQIDPQEGNMDVVSTEAANLATGCQQTQASSSDDNRKRLQQTTRVHSKKTPAKRREGNQKQKITRYLINQKQKDGHANSDHEPSTTNKGIPSAQGAESKEVGCKETSRKPQFPHLPDSSEEGKKKILPSCSNATTGNADQTMEGEELNGKSQKDTRPPQSMKKPAASGQGIRDSTKKRKISLPPSLHNQSVSGADNNAAAQTGALGLDCPGDESRRKRPRFKKINSPTQTKRKSSTSDQGVLDLSKRKKTTDKPSLQKQNDGQNSFQLKASTANDNAQVQGGTSHTVSRRDEGNKRQPFSQVHRMSEEQELQGGPSGSGAVIESEKTEGGQQLNGECERIEEPDDRTTIDESVLVQEDQFSLDEEKIESLLRDEPEQPKPSYMDTQVFLAKSILERIKVIMGNLEEKFKKFCFQIYTPRAVMLEKQTQLRLTRPDAECFSIEVMECRKSLHDAAKLCVKKYDFNSKEVTKRHRTLMKEAADRDTFFLIIADEAHWGPTSEAASDEAEEKNKSKAKDCKQRAYQTLVNSWNDEDHPNVFVLQVSATPYNLLTNNTRLKLEEMCVWDITNGERILRPVSNEDIHSNKVRLHHMKWEELFEHYIQLGVRQILKIPLKKSEDAMNKFVVIEQDGTIRGDDKKYTEILFKGDSSNKVKIQTCGPGERKTLAVCEERGSMRAAQKLKFLSDDELAHYRDDLHTFKVIYRGVDVFLLETADGKYKLSGLENIDDTRVKFTASTTRRSTKATYREESFVVYSSQVEGNLDQCSEYVSLNFLFHSLGEEEKFDQYLRTDDEFIEMTTEVLKKYQSPASREEKLYDILTADYAVHILHVMAIRECHLKERKLSNVLNALHAACGDYNQIRDSLIVQFKEELEKKQSQDFSWIKTELIEAVLTCLEEKTVESVKKSILRFTNNSPDEMYRETPEDVCSYLVACLLFLRTEALITLQGELKMLLEGPEYRPIFEAFEKLDPESFEQAKILRVQENESCRLIDDLVCRKNEQLNGPMKIVRMTTETGNRMYATLCLARKVMMASKDYTFEILRDYGNFKISYVQDNKDASLYRIKQLLQCKKCTNVDPKTGERCLCKDRKRYGEDLKCSRCKHLHTTVDNYEDLKDLPCLIIMVEKGRMGDTFPDNFNAMDLRVSTAHTKNHMLVSLVQEIGRLCRYVKKDVRKSIPYALLGEGLAKELEKNRKIYGTFFDGYENRKDPYIGVGNKVYKRHADYGDPVKHTRRILFEAEPQIGKTGVYLCLVALLRKLIEGKAEEEEEEVEEDEYDREEMQATAEPDATAWKRPYWEDIRGQKKIPKEVVNGKYIPMFGKYSYGNAPEKIVGSDRIKGSQPYTRTSKKCLHGRTRFRTFPKNAAHSFTVPALRGQPKKYEVSVSGVQVQLSVPTLRRFYPLLEKLKLVKDQYGNTSCKDDGKMLKTWIFTPSHGRCTRAYLDYDHTMVDSNNQPVQYVHIIVVRQAEFDSYVLEWGRSHAVICLPQLLHKAGNATPEVGGVGYARLFIQLLAMEYGVPAVFMIDDNTQCVSQKKTETIGEREMLVVEDGKHVLVPVPLFSCLHYMEQQLYGRGNLPPKSPDSFIPHPEVCKPNTQESFTGPWADYGIIGILRNSQFVLFYRRGFKRTHVTALALVNILALKEKELYYKPWQVWEDLNMNNQCDEKCLWVVKYNRFILHKASITDWLPKAVVWKKTTQPQLNPESLVGTDCTLALTYYINRFCPLKEIRRCTGGEINTNKDIEALLEGLADTTEGYILLAVTSDKATVREIRFDVKEAFLETGKVLVLLPASVCINCKLLNWESFNKLLGESIDNPFVFDCISSKDVYKKPIKLVLVHIQAEQAKNSIDGPNGQTGTKTVEVGKHGDGPNTSANKAVECVSEQATCTNCQSPVSKESTQKQGVKFSGKGIVTKLAKTASKEIMCDKCTSVTYHHLYQLFEDLKACSINPQNNNPPRATEKDQAIAQDQRQEFHQSHQTTQHAGIDQFNMQSHGTNKVHMAAEPSLQRPTTSAAFNFQPEAASSTSGHSSPALERNEKPEGFSLFPSPYHSSDEGSSYSDHPLEENRTSPRNRRVQSVKGNRRKPSSKGSAAGNLSTTSSRVSQQQRGIGEPRRNRPLTSYDLPRAEPATAENIDEVLEQDLFLSQSQSQSQNP